MKRIDVKVTFQCNNRCLFCVQGDKRARCADRPTGALKDILKSCRKQGVKSVVFTGGEPTLRKDIFELTAYAKTNKYESIQIQTNGRLFYYADFCKQAVREGVTEFSPALHGPDKKIHDSLTRASGSFIQTVQGIKNLKKMNKYVLTNTVITAQNYKHLPDIARLLIKIGVDQFQLAFIHIAGTAAINSSWVVPRKKEIMSYVKKALTLGKMAGRKVMTEAIPFCLMRGFEDCIAETQIPETRVFDADLTINNYAQYRILKGKSKRSACQKCVYCSVCEGPWKEYPQLFGWEEFTPVLKTYKT